jgi:hypothetical protein
MSTDLALKTLCFLRRCASMATKITPKKKEEHFETGGAEPVGRIGHAALNWVKIRYLFFSF